MIECSDGSLYTGYTTDLERRLTEHNEGRGAKYTRGRTPVTLKYVEYNYSKCNAMRREYELKKLPTYKKRKLISKNVINIKFNLE